MNGKIYYYPWLLIAQLVVGLAGEVGVIQTQCQCTCPLDRQQIRDAVNGYVESDIISPKTRYTESSSTLETTHTTTPKTTHQKTTHQRTTQKTTQQTTPETTLVTTPVTTEQPEYGSGDEEINSYIHYNIDEIFPSEKGDITVVKSKLPIYHNMDDEGYEPQEMRVAETVIVGQKGEKGNLGFPGLPGMPGTNGLDGEMGRPGDRGLKGESGVAGPKGEHGVRGFAGPMGLQGYRGAPGPMGEPGRQGPRGGDGSRGARGEQGPIGRRGLPGKPGPKAERGVPGIPGTNSSVTAKSGEQVAFLARLLDHFGPSTTATHIIFSQIDFNLGDGFEPASGAFNVPVEGVYVFQLHVMAMAEYIAWLALQVNGEPVAYAWASGYTSATEQMGTAMTIQQLKRGDVVNIIQKESSNPPNYLYAHYTLFSGYKLS